MTCCVLLCPLYQAIVKCLPDNLLARSPCLFAELWDELLSLFQIKMSLMNMLRVITHLLVGLGGVNTGHTINTGQRALSCYALFCSYSSPLIMQPHSKCSERETGWTTFPETFKVLVEMQINMCILWVVYAMFAPMGLGPSDHPHLDPSRFFRIYWVKCLR